MALVTSNIDLPTAGVPAATPRHRRRQPDRWSAYELATETARRLPYAVLGCAAVAILVLAALGLLVPRLGDALVIAAVLAVLTTAGFITWKATNR